MKQISISEKNIFIVLGGWFFILILGPYFNVLNLPLRLDHFVFLFLSPVFIFLVLKRIISVPKFIYPLIAYVLYCLMVTFIKKDNSGLSLSKVQMLSEIEMIARIVIVFPFLSLLSKYKNTVDSKKIFKLLMLPAIIASLIGIFQMIQQLPVLFNAINSFILSFYVGRYGAEKSIPELCMKYRAVSTFYHPGNFGLFSSFMLALVTTININKKTLTKFLTTGLIFIFTFSGVLANSKTFLGAFAIIFLYQVIRKKWVVCLSGFLSFTAAMLICRKLVPYVFSVFMTIIYPGKISDFYTNILGTRFGPPPEFIKRMDFELPKSFKRIVVPEMNETARKRIRKVKAGDFDGAGIMLTIDVIKENLLLGIGYNDHVNSSSGDSQITNFLLRGGVLGLILILVFVLLLFNHLFKIFQSGGISESGLLMFIIMCLGAFAFPTFVQDRSSDIAWNIIAISCLRKKGVA